jgi:cytochrome c-type biogenesis protein CcmH/NrfG
VSSRIGISEIEKQASENFEQGFSYLMEENYDEAVQLLARAVHLAGGNARYRAYYGKALTGNKNTYRQAEAEFQAALRLDGDNTDYRLMLGELYVNIGLFKRAEAELQRVLEKAPNNWEARSLLDSLRNK